MTRKFLLGVINSQKSNPMFLDKPKHEEPTVKKKRKGLKDYFDYRNSQINQIGLILFSSFVIATSLHYFFENRFTESRWKESPMRRYKMLDDIINRNLFVDDTKKEVINQLGEPNEIYSETIDAFNYYIGEGARFSNNQIKQLTLIFENNRVTEVTVTPRTD